MIPAERHRIILNLLNQKDIVSIQLLVDELNVSHMTVRRDIERLVQKGLVVAVTGGVQLSQTFVIEPPHAVKATQALPEKHAIACYAIQLIPHGVSVYLDAGTTTLEVAKQLKDRDDLLIITNDFMISQYLTNHSQCRLYHTGGKIDRDNQSSVGHQACSIFDEMNIHIAFLSTSSWDMRGISTPIEEKSYIKRYVIERAQKKYLLTDMDKYGKVAAFHIIDLTVFDALITDYTCPQSLVLEFQEKGITLVRVT